MQAAVLRDAFKARTASRLAAGLVMLIGAAFPYAATAQDVVWPESTHNRVGPVARALMRARHVQQTSLPAPLPDNDAVPLPPVPIRQAATQPPSIAPPAPAPDEAPAPLFAAPPATIPRFDAPGGGDLRNAAIQVTAPGAWTDPRGTESELTLPDNRAASLFKKTVDLTGPENTWFETMSTGHVACVNFHPLYFEELSLERYGDGCGCFQPLFSAARFYGTLPVLPYLIAARPPCSYESSCEYPPAATPVGHVSCLRPADPKAAAFEAGVIAATILLFP